MTPSLALARPVVRASRPMLCAFNILTADLLAVTISLATAVLLRFTWGGIFDPAAYARIWPGVLLFPLAYGLFGQYSPIAHNPVREIRRLTKATTLVFVIFSALLFLFKVGPEYSRVAFVGAWALTLVTVPCARAATRKLYARAPWWGYPVAVFGTRESARELVQGLQARPETGLRPVAIFLTEGGRSEPIRGVPVLGQVTSAPLYARRYKLDHAILTLSDIEGKGFSQVLESHANVFSHVYLMSGLGGFSSLGIETQDICSGVALEVRRSLLLPSRQRFKRMIDVAAGGLVLALLFPVMLLVAALIRLESKGNVLFGHRRIGHGGRKFKMWKFRTMYSNGSEILKQHLRQHPEQERYWRENMKLPDDPRITKVGAILRKTSLDELPQLWNILRGEMSLVGPRPIVNDEIAKYGEWFGLYCRVIPGLTGLWQVSGRSNTTYDQRVEFDTYYVRNWSPWFDIYLLARTVRTVLFGEGAY